MRDYAVKIEVGGLVFRYATDRVLIEETVGGQLTDMIYLPMVISVGPPTAAISLEGMPPVPVFNVEIADAYGDLRSEIEKGEFERVKCSVFTLDDGVVVRDTATGYMTEPQWDEGRVEFTVRMEEDASSDTDTMDVFSHNTFQYTNIVTPLDVNIEPNWEFHDTTPWTVEAYSIVGGTLRDGLTPGADEIYVLIDADDPVLLAGGSPNTVFVPDDELSALSLDTAWLRVSRAKLQFQSSSNRIFDLDDTAGTSFAAWAAAAFIQVVGSNLNDGVYEILGVGTTGGGIRYVEVDPTTLNGLAADEIVNSGVRFYPGTLSTRFPDGSGTPAPLVIGESALFVQDGNTAQTSKIELVKYEGTPAIGVTGSRSHVRLTGVGTGTASGFPIRWNHPKSANIQAAINTQDKIIVAMNGYRPLTDANQPTTLGFVSVEDDTKPHPTEYGYVTQNDDDDSSGARVAKNFRVCHRFNTQSYAESGVTGGALVLSVNNFRLNSACEFPATRVWNSHGHRLKRKEQGTPVKLADYYWTVGRMDLPMVNLVDTSDDDTPGITVGIDNLQINGRLRGKRLDMLQSNVDAARLYRSATDVENPSEFAQVNLSLTNLGQRFAVVKSSEYNQSTKVETVYFQTPEYSMAILDEGYVDGDTVEDLGVEGDSVPNPDDLPYTNLFRYNVDYGSRSDQSVGDLGYTNAVNYFLSQKYRLTFDAVPQNSDSLGKHFPIVYGNVRRVPMLQVISHKVLKEDKATAGDDLYIYASHQCLSRGSDDFDIEILTEQGEEVEQGYSRTQGLPAALNRHKAESPFPKLAYNHFKAESEEVTTGGHVLYSPYHQSEVKESLAGKSYYGIRLRGAEWDPNVGSLDRRFPIRHGVGSTKLYASFAGKRGVAVPFPQHPIDIIYDYVVSFGKFPYTQDSFNLENMEAVKSKTRKLRAAVYMEQPMGTGAFIDKLCKQTGLLWYPTAQGKIYFSELNVQDTTLLQLDKPIAEQLNLVQAVKAKDAGKEVAYSRVVYKFMKNWATNSFERVIDLNSRNNTWCAKASKALGSKKELSLEADWVNDAGVATFAANRAASHMSRSRIEYQLEVVRGSTTFYPGDFVPVTYTPLGLASTPMVIQSVQENDFTDTIVAVRFV